MTAPMAHAPEPTDDRDAYRDLREGIRSLCSRFPPAYWRDCDQSSEYPERFVDEVTSAGYLGALFPSTYGGLGLGIREVSVVLEEIHYSGGNAAAVHAQMYTMASVLRHGSDLQKRKYLPKIASGQLRLQAFAVTEPNAGSDTTRIQTTAKRRGDCYILNGQKVFTSRAEHSDLMLLLARTAPHLGSPGSIRTDGLSLFLVDIAAARQHGLTIRRIPTMVNHHTTEIFLTDCEVPADALIGEEGHGFRYLLDGFNAERILIASECIGDGRWFVERAARYLSERV